MTTVLICDDHRIVREGLRQFVAGIDRPNNVDVEYGLSLAGRPLDIAVNLSARQFRDPGLVPMIVSAFTDQSPPDLAASYRCIRLVAGS